MVWIFGIDIGGGFTDLAGLTEKGDFVWVKVETTPQDLSQGVINTIVKSGKDLEDVKYIVHGQTVVINTIITRSGAKVGLIVTKGFRDILEIARANRRDIFNLRYKKPKPFVPRSLIMEVEERLMYDGSELKPLKEEDVRRAARELVKKGVDAIVISFINSYANPVHELEAREMVLDELKKMGRNDIHVVLSHEITREWREYERTNTAVLNAYVVPRVKEYLGKLRDAFEKMKFNGTFYLMLSNAGVATSEFIEKYPIYTIEGGPIAGIVGGIALAELLNIKNIMVLDGGSTTTKAGLVKNLVPRITSEYYIERDKFNPGYPVRVPVVEITEVGNGGTSIAWIDELGRLRVGPKAAGAYPGPACYGKGGVEPTLTDAYVVAGYLNPRYLLGGELKIDKSLAEKAVKKISDHFNVSTEEAADAIIRIANDQASYVIRLISIQRGYDPRDFVLIAHGGSGPMFAPFIAEELRIPRILVPSIPPGVFNAWGMLMADIRHDLVNTHVMKLVQDEDCSNIMNKIYSDLESEMLKLFEDEGIPLDKVVLMRYADMRYYGQEWTLKIEIPGGNISPSRIGDIIRSFHEAHYREYDFKLPENPVEIVNFHLVGLYRSQKYRPGKISVDSRSIDEALIEEREVYLGKTEGYVKTPIYRRDKIPLNIRIPGPAIIEETTSTIVLTENFEAYKDEYGNIHLLNKGL